jgi:Homoserine dehydrogenase
MKKSVNIGLFGFGTVASSFYHIFSEQKNEIDGVFSVPVNIKKIFTRGGSHPVPENIKKTPR